MLLLQRRCRLCTTPGTKLDGLLQRFRKEDWVDMATRGRYPLYGIQTGFLGEIPHHPSDTEHILNRWRADSEISQTGNKNLHRLCGSMRPTLQHEFRANNVVGHVPHPAMRSNKRTRHIDS